MTGLSPATTYYYRAIATSPNGTVFGATSSFTTKNPPSVATGPALSVTATSARLAGAVNANGKTTTALFQYSTDPSFPLTTTTSIGSGFSGPRGVAVDAAGDVFVADTRNNAVEEILPDGTVKTIGSGFKQPVGRGGGRPGRRVRRRHRQQRRQGGAARRHHQDHRLRVHRRDGVAVDAYGDVFVADNNNNAVKEVLPDETILTIGSGFSFPQAVAVDAYGDVFVADTGNDAIKEVLPDGPPSSRSHRLDGLSTPTGVAVDAAGDVFVADAHNVERCCPAGPSRPIGSGFTALTGVAVDAAGDVFVADPLAPSRW